MWISVKCQLLFLIVKQYSYTGRERERERDYNDSVYLNGSLVITSVLQDLANKEITEIEPIWQTEAGKKISKSNL